MYVPVKGFLCKITNTLFYQGNNLLLETKVLACAKIYT
jgi:hypothetical protein